jgi:hypothetical protein
MDSAAWSAVRSKSMQYAGLPGCWRHDSLLRGWIVTGHGEADAAWRATGPLARIQAHGHNVVERLDHGPAEHLRHPLAVGQAVLDRIDAAVACGLVLPVSTTTAVDPSKRPCGSSATAFCGMLTITTSRARCVLDCRRGNAGLGGQRGGRLWTARVGDPNLVSERREAPRENAANLTRADDSDAHALSVLAGRDVEMVGALELRCGRRAGSFC